MKDAFFYVQIATEAILKRTEEMNCSDRRILIDSVATAMEYSHGLAYSIVCLNLPKVGARWVR